MCALAWFVCRIRVLPLCVTAMRNLFVSLRDEAFEATRSDSTSRQSDPHNITVWIKAIDSYASIQTEIAPITWHATFVTQKDKENEIAAIAAHAAEQALNNEPTAKKRKCN